MDKYVVYGMDDVCEVKGTISREFDYTFSAQEYYVLCPELLQMISCLYLHAKENRKGLPSSGSHVLEAT